MKPEDLKNSTNAKIISDLYLEDKVQGKSTNVRLAILINRQIEAINNLNGSIIKLDKTTSKYNKILIALTILIAILTLIMAYQSLTFSQF